MATPIVVRPADPAVTVAMQPRLTSSSDALDRRPIAGAA